MARIFAIDWDRNEARALVLQSGPTGTSVAGVWSAKLEQAEGTVLSGKQVGAKLAEVMGGEAVGKAVTIIGVGRDHVQIKLLSLPPAPDDELPELVRFQAEREFTTLGTDAALDYIPLSGDAENSHQVLAVALSPAGIAEAREVSQAAGVEPDRITVRALATVSLVLRSGEVAANSILLVVNPLEDEADLAVVDAGRVVLIRTVRLPDFEQLVARQRTLMGEIRRTIAAARQQYADRPVEQVLICGNASAVDQASSITDDLGAPLRMFDPAAHAPGGLTGTRVPPQSLGRFSAVLGMALAEADRRPPIVDFLNVHRKEEKQRFTRTHAIAAAAAALVFLALGAFLWRQYHVVASELVQVQREVDEEKEKVAKLQPLIDQAGDVEEWKSTDVNWLDVMNRVSETLRPQPINGSFESYRTNPFPENTDVVVKSLMFTRPMNADGVGGAVHLTQAVAKDDPAVTALAKRVSQDPRLKVNISNRKRDTTVPGYPWSFSMTIAVEPRDEAAEEAANEAKAEAAKEAASKAEAAKAEAAKAAAEKAELDKAAAEKAAAEKTATQPNDTKPAAEEGAK